VSAALKTLVQLVDDDGDESERGRRRRQRDPIRSAIKSTPGGRDKHVHCIVFIGENGEGFTSPGPDGHVHMVHELVFVAVFCTLAGSHGHELSATRCNERHDHTTGRHVQARR